MKKIEIGLNQPEVAPLLDFVKPVISDLQRELATSPSFSDNDPQLEAAWRHDLLQEQGDDVTRFMKLFNREFVESGNIEIDDEIADSILRATAAIRLRLRSRFLENIPDEILEKGDVLFDDLNISERQAYATYLFLATIQELVIQHR